MREKIATILKKIISEDTLFEITIPDDESKGHYSTNAAFVLSKKKNQSPLAVAESLAKEVMMVAPKGFFSRVFAAPPGFINFWISDEAWREELREILKMGKKYGKGLKVKSKKLKVQVEFVSANPTGPLTMANGRGGFFGDVLSNVLERAHHKVTREYFINDAGNQVQLLGESILAAEGKIPTKENYYKGEYVKKLKGKSAAQAVAIMLQEIKNSLKSVGIAYDVWFSEDKNIRKKGEIKKTLALLEKKGLVEKKDGALWLGDAVLLKSDGNPTYLLVDLAYHYDKFVKRKFDLVIDVWGADHHGNVAPLKKGVEVLGMDSKKLKVLLIQLVRLVSNGKETKMSKRAGEFVTLDDLVKEVGLDVARFFFLMYSPDSHMDFDLALAKERSQKNPVYYVQYAYVRTLSILKKLNVKSLKFKVDLNFLNTKEDKELIRLLARLPEEVEGSARNLRVHNIPQYALMLSRALHNFYEHERVIGEREELQNARAALVLGAKIIFENLFDILGISKPKKM